MKPMKLARDNGYIHPEAQRIEDITAEDATQLLSGWDIVAKEVKAIQP